MADAQKLKQAKVVFNTICETFKSMDWTFDAEEEDLTINTSVNGEDIPMKISIRVDADREFVTLLSYLPFDIPEDKRVEIAVALHLINYRLANGAFDYNFAEGEILFRMNTNYMGSLLGKEVFEYMLIIACNTVDEYNDKILMMCKNKMTLEELLEYLSE